MKLSDAQLQEILKRPGMQKANPDLGAMEHPKHAKPAPALERHLPPKQGGQGGMAVRVEIISLRKRLLDSDNLIAGAKPLRDAIAESLGIDDGSDRIRFDYGQVISSAPGTIVRIAWI